MLWNTSSKRILNYTKSSRNALSNFNRNLRTLSAHYRAVWRSGIANLGALESALAQPRMTFGGEELYPTIVEKASALGFALIKHHPFLDGNKRIGHAAMEVFLVLNGFEISAPVEEQEQIILEVASSAIARDEFTEWLRCHIVPNSI